jgi:hypothetical protein
MAFIAGIILPLARTGYIVNRRPLIVKLSDNSKFFSEK